MYCCWTGLFASQLVSSWAAFAVVLAAAAAPGGQWGGDSYRLAASGRPSLESASLSAAPWLGLWNEHHPVERIVLWAWNGQQLFQNPGDIVSAHQYISPPFYLPAFGRSVMEVCFTIQKLQKSYVMRPVTLKNLLISLCGVLGGIPRSVGEWMESVFLPSASHEFMNKMGYVSAVLKGMVAHLGRLTNVHVE